MNRHSSKRLLAIQAVCVAVVLVSCAAAVVWLNSAITHYVEGGAFRAELEKETAKGLHFPSSNFSSIKRTGLLSAAADKFRAENGRKAMTKFDAHGITGRFNPLGVFLRRWQIDILHIEGGEVGVQTYEPKPEPSLPKSWFHVFLPDRVYLKRIWSEPADVTWRLRDQPAGFFGTRLLITPHGRDFEYRAIDGMMKMALIPDLQLRHTHMLITKTQLSLYELDLGSGGGSIHGAGTAGTGEDRNVDFTLDFDKLPVGEWLPESWRGHVAGVAQGNVHWSGPNPKIEEASLQGSLRVQGARLRDLKFLEELASITRKRSLVELNLNECSAELVWAKRAGEIKQIVVEEKGKFRIEGAVSLHGNSLGGALRLGVVPEYLEWLPKAEEVFTREQGAYLWTTVHLSGTLDSPQQDLSPRLLAALKETPGPFLGAMLRALGEWLESPANGDK